MFHFQLTHYTRARRFFMMKKSKSSGGQMFGLRSEVRNNVDVKMLFGHDLSAFTQSWRLCAELKSTSISPF